ncbi:MAG TPA: hypothetical protein VK021_09395 [Flavobacteriaceae bacterium]|nr:hypothetical protein [Flavobacteriaceae bacterium]
MKITIHGTRDGAKTFTSEFLSGVTDPNSDNPSDNSIGHKGFAISFTKNECVFSKYGIIKDVQGNKRVGYIGFSLGISNESKIPGNRIKEILDQLAVEFYHVKKHIDEYNNLDYFQEDWSFVKDIKKEYQGFVQPIADKNDIEKFSPGERDAAYIYYSSEEELQKYFDVPCQEKYESYKRVLFINKKYEGKRENPLNALRHDENADLTHLKILENLPYKVIIPSAKNGISTKVTSAEKAVRPNEKIHPADRITITFSKKNNKDDFIDGTINDLKEKHPARVEIKEGAYVQKLIIIPPDKLTPKTKTITFQAENWRGDKLEDARISITNKGFTGRKTVENNKATFKEDELEQEWEVKVNDKIEGTIIPYDLQGNLCTLKIKEEKTISFEVKASDYTVSVKNNSRNIKVIAGGKELKFTDQAIEQPCTIIIKAKGYKDKTLNSVYPKSQDKPIEVKLDKKKKLRYDIDAGEGTKQGPDYIEIYEGEKLEAIYEEIKNRITPPKRKRFKEQPFLRTHANKKQKGKLIAQYEDKPKFYKDWRILGGAAAVLLVLVLSFVFKENILGSSKSDDPRQSEYEQIVEFADGNNLNLNLIDRNINKVSKRTSNQSEKGPEEQNESLFPFFGSSKEKTQEINESEDWETLLDKLEDLKSIRKAINNGEVGSLKSFSKNFEYSVKQDQFRQAVLCIDSLYIKEISKVMKEDKMSEMNLNQIASFLNNYQELLGLEINDEDLDALKKKQENIKSNLQLKPKDLLSEANKFRDSILEVISEKIPEGETNQNDESKATSKKRDKKKEVKPEKAIKEKQNAESNTPEEKSESITENTPSDGEKREKDFEDEFWALIEKMDKNKESYDDLINKYSNISSKNKIKIFYHDYLSNNEKFEKFKDFTRVDLKKLKNNKTIEKLKEVLNNKE